MKTLYIKSQEEFDKLNIVEENEEIICEVELKLNKILEIKGRIVFQKKVECNRYNDQYIVSRENSAPSIESWGNSAPSIESRGNSAPSIVSRGNSAPSIESWENSSPSIESWGNSSPSIESWENSSPSIESWGNSAPSIESRGNSSPSIESWENSVIRGIGLSLNAKINLFGFSILIKPKELKLSIKKNSKTVIVREAVHQDFWERHGIKKTKHIILYKRVSKDFKTREGTADETLWVIGTKVTHPKWTPDSNECGAGKFHACPMPYFADEFRSEKGDKYIALEVALTDTHEWTDNPQYPHKIAFREGTVLYECDRFGKEKKGA